MRFDDYTCTLKDGSRLLLRAPTIDDAPADLDYFCRLTDSSPYLLRSPADPAPTLAGVQARLTGAINNPHCAMVLGWVQQRLVAVGQIDVVPRAKVRHRANLGVGVLAEWQGKGIGAALMGRLETLARTMGVSQVELQYIDGNPAVNLYSRLGYTPCGRIPCGALMPDGTYRDMVTMYKQI